MCITVHSHCMSQLQQGQWCYLSVSGVKPAHHSFTRVSSAPNMVQVWTIYSGITGYMLYMCSATKRMASRTPRMVFSEQSTHIVDIGACEAHHMQNVLPSASCFSLQLQCLACSSACSNCGIRISTDCTYPSVHLQHLYVAVLQHLHYATS